MIDSVEWRCAHIASGLSVAVAAFIYAENMRRLYSYCLRPVGQLRVINSSKIEMGYGSSRRPGGSSVARLNANSVARA